MIPEILADVILFLSIFGVDGLLFASRICSEMASAFFSMQPIWSARRADLHYIEDCASEGYLLVSVLFLDPHEEIWIASENIEAVLPLLLANTDMADLSVGNVRPVLEQLKNALQTVEYSFVVSRRIAVDCKDFGDAEGTVSVFRSLRRNQVS